MVKKSEAIPIQRIQVQPSTKTPDQSSTPASVSEPSRSSVSGFLKMLQATLNLDRFKVGKKKKKKEEEEPPEQKSDFQIAGLLAAANAATKPLKIIVKADVNDEVYNKLKPEDPDKVVDIDSTEEHIGYEFSSAQIAEFRKVFSAFDRDGNDSIGVDELGAVLRALGYSPSDSDIDKVLSRFDADHSGDLSFEEYLALMAVWVEEDETQIIEAFKVFDKSGDGYVTISELKRALCRFGEKFTEEEAEEFFQLIDVNKDGVINYEEFVKYMLTEINRGPPPRAVAT